jgi:4-amino-4-deoxy-L-arabinose transferase-like glycosyltransferase
MFDKNDAKKILSENYPLLSILIGITFISLSIGPFQNGDTDWEFAAAKGVLKWGMPYVNSIGNIINQPPLGFYIEGLFFKGVGASVYNGTILVTLLGLGSTIIIYVIGKELYSKPTGLVAAALFALSPWELVLSRSFLIDVQCLFFSLLCLYVGILAIRRGSVKFSIISGIFFAAALLTKYFAAFMLIPLLLFLLYSKPKRTRLFLSQVTAFLLPALLSSLLWYQLILGKNLFYMFQHSDFSDLNYIGVRSSYSFVGAFLWNYGLGAFFVVAVAFSLLLLVTFRKELPKTFRFDLVCLATILPILILNMILGAGLNLKAPYNNAIKYDYQALPFFSLIAASLVGKCLSLINLTEFKAMLSRKLVLLVVMTGVFLLGATVFSCFISALQLSKSNYLVFKVTMDQAVGYSLFNRMPLSQNSFLMSLQFVGMLVLLFGLLWSNRLKLQGFLKSMLKIAHPSVDKKR